MDGGYICPFCLGDTDGPPGPDGCENCLDLEDRAFEQASSGYWETEIMSDELDILDFD